jgi:4-alpha-glucanotransferase
MNELKALHALAAALGVHTEYTDGLKRHVVVAPETLVAVSAALGAPIAKPADAEDALRALASVPAPLVPPVLVAWDGMLNAGPIQAEHYHAVITLEEGEPFPVERNDGTVRTPYPLPSGYHFLTIEAGGRRETATVISAPVEAWRRPGVHRSWGVGTQLAALRSRRSRTVGDLRDLEALCRWLKERGGDLVTVLPLLPTFNTGHPEPSPYSPVSRLFWSELILDLGDAHRPTPEPEKLDVTRADAEVRAALAGHPAPDPEAADPELARYARFRGAQARLGRNWRDWPAEARGGVLSDEHVDPEEERFHLVAQTLVRQQLRELRTRLDDDAFRLGLDLAVGVHPDGYDTWSRQSLFAGNMAVGAPPDGGFPSGQDWGFSPVLPAASRREGHRYIAASIAHQASLAGVLRIDHIMAWTRLYWIPHGFGLHQGTYVTYPADELFAVLTLESHRHHSEVMGENLGTVPKEIYEALPRHRIWGMYLAQFQAADPEGVKPPTAKDVALVGTHDTPPFAGWLKGTDIEERVRYGLLPKEQEGQVALERAMATERLAREVRSSVSEPREFLGALLDWLGRSESPLVAPWFEDLWLEDRGVNLPGTPSSVRPNWQRPMRKLLDDIFTDPDVEALLTRLHRARAASRRAALRHQP